MKNNKNINLNIARIPSTLNGPNASFFKYWLEIIKPMHHLTNKEIDVLAALLIKRLELSKSIIDVNVLDQILLGTEIRKEIRTELNLSPTHFHVILTKLKKAGIIEDHKINKKFIPNIDPKYNEYRLVLLFDFKDVK